MNLNEERSVQGGSEEEDEEVSVVASVALDVFVDPEAGLGGGRREGVGRGGPHEEARPGRGFAGEIVGGELGEGVEGQQGEEGHEAGEDTRGGYWGGGVGGCCGCCGGGAAVEDFEVAGVAEPGIEGGFGNAEGQGIR